MSYFVMLTRWDGERVAVNPDHVALVEGRKTGQVRLRFAIPSSGADTGVDPFYEEFEGTVDGIVGALIVSHYASALA